MSQGSDRASTNKVLPAHRTELVAQLVALVDGGHPADAYALCESVGRHHPDTACQRAARIYAAHLDLARGTRREDHAVFFASMETSSDAWERGHAHSGLGFASLVKGELEDALARFARAEAAFTDAQAPVDALKARMRRVSALHYLATSDTPEALVEAERLATSGLGEARALGDAARGLVMTFAGALGAQRLAAGRRTEALASLKEAARAALASKPQTPASAFAQFQFGHALFQAGQAQEALTWLVRAEAAQRLVEPSARVATLVLLARVHRSRGEFAAAWHALARLKGLRIPNVERTAAAEALEEEVALLLAVFREDDALKAVQSAGLARSLAAFSVHAPGPPCVRWWAGAPSPSGEDDVDPAEILIDFCRQTVFIVRLRGGVVQALSQFAWRADSALGPVLAALAGRVERGEGLSFDASAARALFEGPGRQAATARRTWYRVLDDWNTLLAEAFPGPGLNAPGRKASLIDLSPFGRIGVRVDADSVLPMPHEETSP